MKAIAWLGLGDSYVSGEGLPDVSLLSDRGAECQRALATDNGEFASEAWAPRAARILMEERQPGLEIRLDFEACTGAITDDVFSTTARSSARQLSDALGNEAVGDRRWDIVSLSMAGNNMGFGDVIKDCIGWDPDSAATFIARPLDWPIAPWVGCSIGEEDLKQRVDPLMAPGRTGLACEELGDDANGSSGIFQPDELTVGAVTLPELYDALARCVVESGGVILVMGYPHLVDGRGSGTRLRGIGATGFAAPVPSHWPAPWNARASEPSDLAAGPRDEHRARGCRVLFVDPT